MTHAVMASESETTDEGRKGGKRSQLLARLRKEKRREEEEEKGRTNRSEADVDDLLPIDPRLPHKLEKSVWRRPLLVRRVVGVVEEPVAC